MLEYNSPPVSVPMERRQTIMIKVLCSILIAVFMLAACDRQAAEEDEGWGLKLSILNYTDMPLGVVYVNGVWAGGMGSWGGGTSFAGSAGVPTKWRPGMTMTVEWQDDALYQKDKDALHKAEVEVEPYTGERPSFLWVAFFPDGKIRLFPSSYAPGFPQSPPPLRLTPGDVCAQSEACAKKYIQ
ncbi:DUF3304 domain-containing protein [Cupriavidus sp. HPC(L)]|uniref:DUF3304 domain-containing protein n=1 Tax=Cupriavidus sp. HPC(L) TaxID=1217418 RepID=UPI0020A09777|nr:DUF3304 domain-containing protein [Cupriavidus sp. HPC(L)]